MEQCPARAYRRDEKTGAVLIDADQCLGCRYCAWVCPYGAPRFDEARGVMTKCDFCVDKQHEGGEPACVTSCPTGALTWGELAEEELVQDVPGFARVGIGPSIRIEPLQETRRIPEMTHPPAMPPWRRLRDGIRAQITLKHEWTLAVFTVLAATLVGTYGSFHGSDNAVRYSMIAAEVFWLVHNIIVWSPVAVFMEVLFFSSNVIGLVRHRKASETAL